MRRLAVLALVTVAACTPGYGTDSVVRPATSTALAGVGDSITNGWTAYFPAPIENRGIPNAAFTYESATVPTIGRIAASTTQPLEIIMGGVNDIGRRVPVARVISVYAGVIAAAEARGINVRPATEPYWAFPEVEQINTWLRATYPDTIDCAPLIADPSWSLDRVHPSPAGYGVLARCIKGAL